MNMSTTLVYLCTDYNYKPKRKRGAVCGILVISHKTMKFNGILGRVKCKSAKDLANTAPQKLCISTVGITLFLFAIDNKCLNYIVGKPTIQQRHFCVKSDIQILNYISRVSFLFYYM